MTSGVTTVSSPKPPISASSHEAEVGSPRAPTSAQLMGAKQQWISSAPAVPRSCLPATMWQPSEEKQMFALHVERAKLRAHQAEKIVSKT